MVRASSRLTSAQVWGFSQRAPAPQAERVLEGVRPRIRHFQWRGAPGGRRWRVGAGWRASAVAAATGVRERLRERRRWERRHLFCAAARGTRGRAVGGVPSRRPAKTVAYFWWPTFLGQCPTSHLKLHFSPPPSVRASSLSKLGFRTWSDSRPFWRWAFGQRVDRRSPTLNFIVVEILSRFCRNAANCSSRQISDKLLVRTAHP